MPENVNDCYFSWQWKLQGLSQEDREGAGVDYFMVLSTVRH